MVVNATPLDSPVRVETLPRRALIVDLRYGPEINAWIRSARAAGIEAYDGLGLLVFQARRSLAQHEAIIARAVARDGMRAASATRENWLELGAMIQRSLTG